LLTTKINNKINITISDKINITISDKINMTFYRGRLPTLYDIKKLTVRLHIFIKQFYKHFKQINYTL